MVILKLKLISLIDDISETPNKIKKIEDEDILKCYGCKHVYRTLVELRAHLAAYEKCSNSTWVCDECPRTFGAERSLVIIDLLHDNFKNGIKKCEFL